MAYNSNKGTQHTGDVQYEGDPTDVQIDFENDFIALKTNGSQRLIVSGSAITASVDVSGSGALMVGGKLTAGNSKLTFDGTTLVLTGALQQDSRNGGKVRFILPEESDAFSLLSPDESSTAYRFDGAGVDHYFNSPARFGANTGTPTHTVSVTGHVSASIGVTSSGFHTLTTVIDRTHISSSLNISGSKFYGSGEGLTNIAAAAVAPAGNDTQVQYNDSGASAGSANMTFNGTTLTVTGLSNTGNTTLGDAGGDSVTINAATVDIPNVAAGTDNTVVVYDGSSLVTDEIDSRVWGSTLVDASGTPVANQIARWTDANTAQGATSLTYNGTVMAVTGAISASGNISGSKFYSNGLELLAPAITSLSNAGANRVITSDGLAAASAEANLTFDAGSYLRVAGNVSASLGVSGSSLHVGRGLGTTGTVIDSTHVSSSLNISGSKFYGDGSTLDGVVKSAPGGDHQVLFNDDTAFGANANLTFVDNADFRVTGSIAVTGSALGTLTVIDGTHVSSSLNISGSKFYGDGSTLTGVGPAQPPGTTGNILFNDSNDYAAVPNLSFMGNSDLRVTGSLSVTGSALGTLTVIDGAHVSSSLNISGAAFYGDGSTLSGLTVPAIANYNNPGTSRVITSINGNTVNAQANMTFNGSLLSVTGDASVSNDISASHGIHVTGSDPHIAIGTQRGAADNPIMLSVRPDDGDGNNKILAMFQRTEASGMRTCFAVTGSGQVVVGGPHLEGVLNISGSTAETLISAKSDTANPAFTVDGVGDAVIKGYVSSSHMKMQSLYPTMQLTSSHAANVNAQIGINSAGNILLQNNTSNKHIVFKTNDAGSIKEGLRLDGAVPEVVVNQTAESLINFRVESKNNTHMLYVTGSDQVGIGVSDPAIGVTLDVSGSAMRLRNSSTPASAGAVGVQGEIRWDADYIYICVATDTWKRVAIGTW